MTLKWEYGIFGETPSLTSTPFGYTGQRYDSEVGLYNYKARIYSPSIGRFLQPDPIGFDAGDLNLYAYVANDAVNFSDSFGLTGSYRAPSSPVFQNSIDDPILRETLEFFRGLSSGRPFGKTDWGDPISPLNKLGKSIADSVATAALALLNPNQVGQKINIFGEMEAAPNFRDVVTPGTPEHLINGRPSTGNMMNGSASDIFLRSSPINPQTLSEIKRLSGPRTNITIMQPAGSFQGAEVANAIGNRATVTAGPQAVLGTNSSIGNPLSAGGMPVLFQIIRMVVGK